MTAPAFTPLPGLGNAHLQTLLGNLTGGGAAGPPTRTWSVTLPDGDVLTAEVSTPAAWRPGDATAVTVHGLTGSHTSGYNTRLARKLHARGVRCARLNLRGSGSGVGLARKPYHGGCSPDVAAFLRELWRREPDAPVDLVGFSLGGNIVLKLAAEFDPPPAGLRQVIAVCPAVDLDACWRRLAEPRNLLYHRFFVAQLRRLANDLAARFPDDPPPGLPRGPISIWTFDELYTARRHGFAGAEEYYRLASSARRLGAIAVPTRILAARDDPIVDSRALQRAELSPRVGLHLVDHGGHLGFLGRPGGRARYMDAVVLRWLAGPPVE